MSKRAEKASAAAETAIDRVLADLSPEDYEEALSDLIEALRERLNAAKATRR